MGRGAEKCEHRFLDGRKCYNPRSYLYKGHKYCYIHADERYAFVRPAQYYIISHDILLNRQPMTDYEVLKWIAEAINNPAFEPMNPWHMMIMRKVNHKDMVMRAFMTHHTGDKVPAWNTVLKMQKLKPVQRATPKLETPLYPPKPKKRKKKKRVRKLKPFNKMSRIAAVKQPVVPKHGY